MFGFGGIPQLPTLCSNDVSHCFPLNGNEKEPEVFGVLGIMQIYEFSIRNCELSGPTFFEPIILEAIKMAKTFKEDFSNKYAVLFILTDGIIQDMKETKKLIVQCSELPISIIIVGVGNTIFDDMHVLDGDNGLQDEEVNLFIFFEYCQLKKFLNTK